MLNVKSFFFSLSDCDSPTEAVNSFEKARFYLYGGFSFFSAGVPLLALFLDYFLVSKVLKRHAYAHVDEQLESAKNLLEWRVVDYLSMWVGLEDESGSISPGQILVHRRRESLENSVEFLLKLQDGFFCNWLLNAEDAANLNFEQNNQELFHKFDHASPFYKFICSEMKNFAYATVLSAAELGSLHGGIIGVTVAAIIILSTCTSLASWPLALLTLAGFTAVGLLLGGVAGGLNAFLPVVVKTEQQTSGFMHRLFNDGMGAGVKTSPAKLNNYTS